MKLLLAIAVLVLLIPLGIILAGVAMRAVEDMFKEDGKEKGKK